MADAVGRIRGAGIARTREHARFRDATSLEFRVCCWGSVSSLMVEGHPHYTAVTNFARELAGEGIPIVAGGPYMERGHGVGVQHAAHRGAFSVHPDLSIGIDLHVPEWGGGTHGRIYRRQSSDGEWDTEMPVGFYIMAESLEDRMMFMEILSQVFIGFPVFGFGTDFERARMGQILYFIETLREKIPESIYVGTRGFREFGIRPRVVLIGPYDYCRALVEHIAESDATRAWVNGDERGIFIFRENMESARRFILDERTNWRKTILAAGGIPNN
uniref:Uncharacterized protein n=1 Tax=Candidatus Kentrum sp. LFY TaxID=2126342 RepID=A0A450UBL6_9GAMM|nr:MAG: hypothetical protein BECKLFY1418B_GA0070995_101619 [Candidatus Kentron sp. LFY]VFJ93994.1 MAG: hypothetical protein BECKLFY1418A_GA0070994_10364 [Candidatus Kentron sp. LFY]VFK23864.1 MAG: hypothetical protein BECKLFY1418C_GA0070996_11584 [Candidatus Kentron sp. LFY]